MMRSSMMSDLTFDFMMSDLTFEYRASLLAFVHANNVAVATAAAVRINSKRASLVVALSHQANANGSRFAFVSMPMVGSAAALALFLFAAFLAAALFLLAAAFCFALASFSWHPFSLSSSMAFPDFLGFAAGFFCRI